MKKIVGLAFLSMVILGVSVAPCLAHPTIYFHKPQIQDMRFNDGSILLWVTMPFEVYGIAANTEVKVHIFLFGDRYYGDDETKDDYFSGSGYYQPWVNHVRRKGVEYTVEISVIVPTGGWPPNYVESARYKIPAIW